MTKKEFQNRVLPVKNKLYRRALFLLSDREEAEDTLQDVFLRLWNLRDKLNEYKNIEAFAMTITKNCCIDKLRSYKHRNQNDVEIGKMLLETDNHDPEKALALNESTAMIHNVVQKLPERQRETIYLRDIEGYSYDEIEEITKLSRGTIRAHLSRARKAVREICFKNYDYEY